MKRLSTLANHPAIYALAWMNGSFSRSYLTVLRGKSRRKRRM